MKEQRKIERVLKELEKLDKDFVVKGVPKEYGNLWTPKNEVRLWSIPRSSGELLKALVLTRNPRNILELGTSAGYSTIWIASALGNRKSKIYTVELTKPKIEMAKKYFKKAGVKDKIKQIQGDIKEALKNWNKKIDFVFLDADKHNYLTYIKMLEPYLTESAVIVADNAIDFKSNMKDYLGYVTSNPKYFSTLLNVDNGLMITIKLKGGRKK